MPCCMLSIHLAGPDSCILLSNNKCTIFLTSVHGSRKLSGLRVLWEPLYLARSASGQEAGDCSEGSLMGFHTCNVIFDLSR